MLLYKGYTYAKNSSNRNGTLWYCSSRRSKKCPAQVFSSNDETVTAMQPDHCHVPPNIFEECSSTREEKVTQYCCTRNTFTPSTGLVRREKGGRAPLNGLKSAQLKSSWLKMALLLTFKSCTLIHHLQLIWM
ncbi:uncharacterized protein LOC120626937 [Pararge aegeria]|uniref:uncharacterized protein LOC120626937 n=1 Tax=Pararge aegeria TaxID=116150 RepID=UPI0019D1CA6B|nr:uncharacterized protein LOC120626937 [Pararge aegeria]